MIAFNSLFHKILFSRWAMTALIPTYDCWWNIKPYWFEIQDQLQIGYSAYFEKAWFYSSGSKVIAASQHSFFLFCLELSFPRNHKFRYITLFFVSSENSISNIICHPRKLFPNFIYWLFFSLLTKPSIVPGPQASG